MLPETPDDLPNTSVPITQVEMQASEWRGPLPAPEDLAQYEAVLVGAADRILSMAEIAQANEHAQNLQGLSVISKGQGFAFVLKLIGALTWIAMVASGIWLTSIGQEYTGVAILGSSLAMWVLAYISRFFTKDNGLSSNGSD